MMLLIPLLSATLWAVVVILDRITLKKALWTPSQALLMSSVFPFVGSVFLLTREGMTIPLSSAVMVFIAGCLFSWSNALYFTLIRRADEVDEIAAWDAAPSLFLGLFTLPFGLILQWQQWVGIVLVMASLFLLRQRRTAVRIQIRDHLLLFAHTFLLALSFMLFDLALQHQAYSSILPLYLLGESTGLLLLLFPRERASLKRHLHSIWSYIWVFFVAEICAVFALLAQTYAFQTLHPAVATALSGAYPLLIFLLGPILRHVCGFSARMFPKSDNCLHLLFLFFFIVGLVLLV